MLSVSACQNLLAYYIRLSVEDRNKASKADESDSIANQRALLRKYVNEHEDLKLMQSADYVDDGESGMLYGRSSFGRLMDDVKKGIVKAIIVKDYSRFGRGYINAADYLEQIFPFIGVRFISVNDNYDSKNYKYGSAGMVDIGFKQIMHQYYSVSLSQKILCAHNQLAKSGKFHSGFAFFGYVKSSEKYKLEIDEGAAETIRYIFDAALHGKRAGEIAAELNKMNVSTPLQVLLEHNKTVKSWREKASRYIWNATIVRNILKEERYTGTYIYGKTRVDTIGSKKKIYKPREEWTIVPDVFPVIISKEIFDKIHEKPEMKSKAKPVFTTPRKFHNIVCGYCGMALTYIRSENPYYKCREYKNGVTVSCKENRAYESDLMVLALQAIKEEAQNIRRQTQASDQKSSYKGSKRDRIKSLRLKHNAIPAKKERIFEQLLSGEITQEQNAVLYGKLEQEEKALTEEIDFLKNASQTTGNKSGTSNFFQSIFDSKKLDENLINLFVRQIRVFMNDRIEISITLKPLNDQEQIITKTFAVPKIKGNRVWLYYRSWYNEEKLKRQKNNLLQFTAEKGWDIAGECGGYQSNSKKLFEKVKAAAEKNEFDILLVEDMNCISRKQDEIAEAIKIMRENKVRIIATTGTPYYTFLDSKLYEGVKRS